MKRIPLYCLSVLLVLIFGLSSAYAVPAYRGWRTVSQPDGTTITIRQMGDEFFHYWENEEGQQVAKDEDGWWRVLDQPATQSEVSKRKQASRTYNRARSADEPSKVGGINLAPRGLVILVNYSDVSFRSTNTQAAMSELMNAENYTYNNATGSVREFFKAQSNGKYVPDFDVVGPYTLANNRAHYGANGSDGNDVLPGDMIIEACKAADADGVDFTRYNNDGDTYVDFVYVIYAGEGAADSDVSNAIWPHNWTISSARYYGNCTYTASQCKVDGLTINNYACSGELKGRSTTRCPIGTITHEFGHVLGLPDYYVTDDAASNYNTKYTPGAWHIMDYGSYNNDGRTPPNYSPHDKYFFGWMTPTLLAKDEPQNGLLTTDYGSAYQINGGTTLKTATAQSTVWYLENRQKNVWDKYLPGHGMVVWEVTYNSSNWNNNSPNNETVGYTVVTANNLTKPYKPYVSSTTASSTSGTPFPGTSNIRSYTPATGCALTNITESDGVITFTYNGGIDCHNISANGTGCAIEPSTSCVENGNGFTATITPTDDTYDYTSLTVTRGSTTLTSGTHYTLSTDKKTLTVKAAAVTGSSSDAFTITAVWTKARCTYYMLGENCTEELIGTVNLNGALNLTIAPSSGYTLADAECWDVTMGDTQLTYGTGFTYSGTTFSISKVTDDVQIVAYGLRPVTWRANGSVYATNVAVDNKITLPNAPGDCESGKKFVGWCTSSNYSSASTAPTFAKDGDSYSVANYYAVYATASGSSSTSKSYSFSITSDDFNTTSYAANNNEKTTTATAGDESTVDVKWTSNQVMKNSSNMQFQKSNGYIYNSTDLGTIKSVTVTSSAGSFTTYYGDSEQPSSSTTVGGGFFKIKVGSATGTASNIAVTFEKSAGSSMTYSDYSTVCGTPCSNTPSMSFANATVNKTTADASFTQAVTITGKGSGQTVAYSSSDETVGTVNSSGVVTLKGKIGSTTITASLAANGTYCSASASYTLNVTAAPINVTLYYSGTSATLSNQTNPYTLPTTGAYVADMCSGDWTFDGWLGSTYAKSETKPTYITQLTATGSAYAVYKTTETTEGGGGGGSSTESVTFSDRYTANTSLDKVAIAIGSHATVTFDKGSNNNAPQYYTTGTAIRWYGGGTCVVATDEGKITGITITFGSSDGSNSISANTGTLNEGTWEGEAQSVTFTQSGSSGNRRIAGIAVTISGGGGGTTSTTYYATSPDCAVVCELTGITLNTDNVNNSFTTGDAFSAEGLVVTANYSNCEGATVTPTNVSDPDMSTSGQKTITVTYTENEVTETSTYTITVTDPVTYTVTWSVDGTETSVMYNEGAALVLPTAPSDCSGEGGKTFVGWTAESSVTGTAPTDLFTTASGTVTADATYYAVYATATTSGSGASNDYALYNGALTEGDYLIVYSGGAMKASVSNSRLAYEEVTATNDIITTTDASIIWHIAASGDYWTIYNAGESKYAAATGTKNQAQLLVSGTDNKSLWTCSSSAQSEIYNFVNKANTESNVNANLRKNGEYGFACYASSTGGALSLYKNSSSGSGGGGETTYSDYSLNCTSVATYTVTWKACGEVFATQTFAEGAALVLPNSTPEDNAGKHFCGWTASEHYTGASAPSDVFTSAGAKTVTADVTYYAIYQ